MGPYTIVPFCSKMRLTPCTRYSPKPTNSRAKSSAPRLPEINAVGKNILRQVVFRALMDFNVRTCINELSTRQRGDSIALAARNPDDLAVVLGRVKKQPSQASRSARGSHRRFGQHCQYQFVVLTGLIWCGQADSRADPSRVDKSPAELPRALCRLTWRMPLALAVKGGSNSGTMWRKVGSHNQWNRNAR
jgi:hypothetical protein